MRVKICTALAILFLAFCVVCARTYITTSPPNRRHKHGKNDVRTMDNGSRRRLMMQRLQGLQGPADCCPTVTKTITPNTGKSRSGKIVDIVNHGGYKHMFNETRCTELFDNKPCRYIDRYLRPYSRCLQQFSYVYALVKDRGSVEAPRLDYIEIASGCSCKLIPPDPP